MPPILESEDSKKPVKAVEVDYSESDYDSDDSDDSYDPDLATEQAIETSNKNIKALYEADLPFSSK